MTKTHHYLCKINILEKHSPDAKTYPSQCDCEFISGILNSDKENA